MKIKFKKSKTNFGCYIQQGNIQDTYLPNENFTIQDVLNANVGLTHKVWFIRKNCELNTKELIKLAIGCCWVLLPFFEEEYPDDKKPRKAIESSQYYLDGKISLKELIRQRDDASANYNIYRNHIAINYNIHHTHDAINYTICAVYAYAIDMLEISIGCVHSSINHSALAVYYQQGYEKLLLKCFKDFFKKKK